MFDCCAVWPMEKGLVPIAVVQLLHTDTIAALL